MPGADGIFDDPKLVAELKEAVATIAKASTQVTEIFGGSLDAQKFNQATRWVNTKEEHCAKVITLLSEYLASASASSRSAHGLAVHLESDFMDALKAHHGDGRR